MTIQEAEIMYKRNQYRFRYAVLSYDGTYRERHILIVSPNGKIFRENVIGTEKAIPDMLRRLEYNVRMDNPNFDSQYRKYQSVKKILANVEG